MELWITGLMESNIFESPVIKTKEISPVLLGLVQFYITFIFILLSFIF